MTLMITIAFAVKTVDGSSVVEYGVSDTSINANPDDVGEEIDVASKHLRMLGETALENTCSRLEEFKTVADRLI